MNFQIEPVIPKEKSEDEFLINVIDTKEKVAIKPKETIKSSSYQVPTNVIRMIGNIIKVKEIKTMCFKDKNENVIAELDNVDEIALTSNVIEEKDILGNVENIKRGETTLSFTNITNKEDLFKVLGVDTSNVPDAYSILLTKPIQRRKHKKKRINKKM